MRSHPADDVRYSFGEFLLDCDARQLLAGGREIHLSPKAFELLSRLIESRPRALSKKELQDRLWPETFVEETNIASLVAEIRRALGDSASNSTFVRTVHRFGYRFDGNVIGSASGNSRGAAEPRFAVLVNDRQVPLGDGVNVIGRAFDAAVQVDSPGVSRHHARIVVSGDGAVVEDLGSKNGTMLNDEQLAAPKGLADGDRIRLGVVVLTFRIGLQQSPTETVSGPARRA
jgi:DNA-binding winged helix-turn-helix (wHTH) protein